MVLKLSTKTAFIFIDSPLLQVYQSGNNISGKKNIYRVAAERLLLKYKDQFKSHPLAVLIQHINLLVNAIQERNVTNSFHYAARVLWFAIQAPRAVLLLIKKVALKTSEATKYKVKG